MQTHSHLRCAGPLALSVACSVFALGCSNSGGGASPTPAATVGSAMLGPAGGIVVVDSGPFAGAELVVPAGALDDTTEIRIVESPDTSFGGGQPVDLDLRGTVPASALLGLEPSGLLLNERATITLPGGFVPDPVGGGDPLARREKLMFLRPSSGDVQEAFLAADGSWQIDELGIVFAVSYGGDIPFPSEQFLPNRPNEVYDFDPLLVLIEEASRLSGIDDDGVFVFSQTTGRRLAQSGGTSGIPPARPPLSDDFLVLEPGADGSINTLGFGTRYTVAPPQTGDELIRVTGSPLRVLPATVTTGVALPPQTDGEISLSVTFGVREPFETPGGRFPDTLPVSLQFSGVREARFDFVLAFGQGPIATRISGGLGATDGVFARFLTGARSSGRIQDR